MFPPQTLAVEDRHEYLSLEPITVTAGCTRDDVPGRFLSISGTLQVKVDTHNGETKGWNVKQIMLACQHFLGKVSAPNKSSQGMPPFGPVTPKPFWATVV